MQLRKPREGRSALPKTFAVWALSALFAFSPMVAEAQTTIGNVTKVVRQVQGTLANNVRTLKTQDDVLQNEVINKVLRMMGDCGRLIASVAEYEFG